MAVKFGVMFILNFSLSSILGKKVFVIAPFVVSVHSLCHHLTLCSFCSLITIYTVFSTYNYVNSNKYLFEAYVPLTCFDQYVVFIREVNIQAYKYIKFCK